MVILVIHFTLVVTQYVTKVTGLKLKRYIYKDIEEHKALKGNIIIIKLNIQCGKFGIPAGRSVSWGI